MLISGCHVDEFEFNDRAPHSNEKISILSRSL